MQIYELLAISAIAFLYFGAAKFCLLSLHLGIQPSSLWLPSGFALAVVLWQVRWAWLGVAIGSLWINRSIDASWPLAIGDTVSATSQALLGAFLLQRSGFCNALVRLRDVLQFIGIAVFATPVWGAALSTALAHDTGAVSRTHLLQNGWTLWTGDSMGILVVTPLLLTWRYGAIAGSQGGKYETQPSEDHKLEQLLGIGLLIGIAMLVFYCRIQPAIALYPLEYLPFPCIIWAALRFGQPKAALASFLLSAIAISGTLMGRGPFAALPTDIEQEVLLLQAFMGVVTLTGLIVAAVTTERQQAEAEVRLTVERNRLLSEIALKICQSLDLDVILNRTAAEVRQFLQADRVFITRFDAEGGCVVAESVAAGWPSMLGWQVNDPAIRQEIYEIFDPERIRVVADTEKVPRSPFVKRYHQRYQVRAGMGVPLMIDLTDRQENTPSAAADSANLFGALVVNQCSAPRHWQPQEIDLMQQLATQVSIAIQQAQLYQQVQSLNATLEEQVVERTLQLQNSMVELQELNQFRDVLIHAIAHDLRTTVMGTLLVLKNLQNQPGEQIPIARTLLERMTQSGEVQLNKLNSLLEVYTYETEEVTLDQQPCSLAAVLLAAASELTPLLEQNQAMLIENIPADLPPVWIDAAQIQRVFRHLITNAVKHNPPGVTITIAADVESEKVRCWVIDTGTGIYSPQRDRLFDLRLSSSADRQLLGISLGLYLCQQIIAAHGGTIGVFSEPGAGAKFWVLLPVATI